MMTESGTAVSRKEVEWRERLARFAASGQQVRQFCLAEAVSEAVFLKWRQRLQGGAAKRPAGDGAFIAVESGSLSTRSEAMIKAATLEVKLDLGHGLMLHIVKH